MVVDRGYDLLIILSRRKCEYKIHRQGWGMSMWTISKIFLLTASLGLYACVSDPKNNFENEYSRNEIGTLTAKVFDVKSESATSALKPIYKKYGSP